VNAITGDVVVRDMTASEAEQRTKDLAKHAALAEAKAARTAAREALLDRLGITADEAQLLLGGM
jgi:hypothetical protein